MTIWSMLVKKTIVKLFLLVYNKIITLFFQGRILGMQEIYRYAKAFGNNLKQLRLERSWKQCEVAEKLDISVSTYANWEQGRRTPNIYFCLLLTKIHEVDMNALFDIGNF